VNPHCPPVQVAVELAGTAQVVHCAPQAVTSLSATQSSLQLCVPVGHWPVHAMLLGMHWPAQGFWSWGQVALQDPEAHAAPPPVGVAQGSHAAPQ
jgi:hypothetical protein